LIAKLLIPDSRSGYFTASYYAMAKTLEYLAPEQLQGQDADACSILLLIERFQHDSAQALRFIQRSKITLIARLRLIGSPKELQRSALSSEGKDA
jgi:hypothetical protein